jgi:replication fork protection complex subunit Tof1/Swi1
LVVYSRHRSCCACCVSRISFFFFSFLLFGEIGLDLDASDEPQWYIPAGIEPPDLQRSLTVIEQFETTPLDLEGKRAAQLLRKKRQTRRRRRRRRTTASGSEGEAKEDDDSDDDDDVRKRKVARKAREQEKYMSAQFIEDSDEEYGRDIDGFFAREAALRERTALAAIDSLSHIGTMRPTGTKKRRRAQQPSLPTATDDDTTTASATKGGRMAKRTRRSATLSTSGMHDGDGEDGDRGGNNAGALRRSSPAAAATAASISDDDADDNDDEEDDDDDGGDDGSGGGDINHGDSSSLVYRDVAAGKHPHPDPPPLVASKAPRRPRARPRYRGVTLNTPEDSGPDTPPPRKITDDIDDDEGQAQQGHDQPLPTGATTPMLPLLESHKGDPDRVPSSSTSSSNGGGSRKGRMRLIISDDEV